VGEKKPPKFCSAIGICSPKSQGSVRAECCCNILFDIKMKKVCIPREGRRKKEQGNGNGRSRKNLETEGRKEELRNLQLK